MTPQVSAHLNTDHCTPFTLQRKCGKGIQKGEVKKKSKYIKEIKEERKRSEKLLKFQFKNVHIILVGS